MVNETFPWAVRNILNDFVNNKIFPWAVLEGIGLACLISWFVFDGHSALLFIGAPMGLVGIFGVIRAAMGIAREQREAQSLDSE